VFRGAHGGGRESSALSQAGFTLVEVMVVVAMIAILAASAVVFVRPSSHAASSLGYANQIAALCDSARQRAVATRSYQKLEIEEDRILHWQGTTEGMTPPEEWSLVGTVAVPLDVVVAATSPRTHTEPDDGVPEAGAGLPAEIDFAPDGSSDPMTVFITDSRDHGRARVAVYRASGSAYAYNEW
jgi:prepilin-type N-terminal cleavage/methylation domain-containing protein